MDDDDSLFSHTDVSQSDLMTEDVSQRLCAGCSPLSHSRSGWRSPECSFQPLPPRPGAAADGSTSVEKHNAERPPPIIPPSSKQEAEGADEVAGTKVPPQSDSQVAITPTDSAAPHA